MYLFIQLIIYLQIFGNFLYINSIGFPKVKFYVFLNVHFVHLQCMYVCL